LALPAVAILNTRVPPVQTNLYEHLIILVPRAAQV
jgi:hypothetical protein